MQLFVEDVLGRMSSLGFMCFKAPCVSNSVLVLQGPLVLAGLDMGPEAYYTLPVCQ